MKLSRIQTVAKAIIGAAGLAITALQPIYGGHHWFVALTAVYGGLAIYLVRNTPDTQGKG